MKYNRMKEIRTYFDKTQKEMSEILGVSRSTYAGWENGLDSIPLLKLNNFCNYFNICLDYICGLTNTKNYKIINLNIDKSTVGNNLKYIRKKNNNTQAYISNIIQTDQSNYSKYELGKTLILTNLITGFARNYNVSIDWLCGKKEGSKII